MGGNGGADTKVTQTTTNPKVPSDMMTLADALNFISTGLLGNPMNFGSTGLDAPKQPMQVASMGDMFAKPGFQMGANRLSPMGRGRNPSMAARGIAQTPASKGKTSYGDLFSRTAPSYKGNDLNRISY